MIKEKRLITKKSGDKVIFDESKLRKSLEKAGSSYPVIDKIVSDVLEVWRNDMTTEDVYNFAYSHLKLIKHSSASKYKLKQALMELGPSGYPFEKFVSFLFQEKNYKVNVGIVMQGKCVSHEIDVFAEREDKIILIECKYRNNQNNKINIHVPLYVNSRFLDIKSQLDLNPLYKDKKEEMWIVTNTKFSEDALKYSYCNGNITLLSWDYPHNNSLKDWIELSNLHPITCLSSITVSEKKELLSKNIVSCKEIYSNIKVLHDTSISPRKYNDILKEINFIMEEI